MTIVGCFAVLRCKNRDILMNSLSIGTILGLMHGSFIISFYSPLNHVIRASHSKVVGIRVLVPTVPVPVPMSVPTGVPGPL